MDPARRAAMASRGASITEVANPLLWIATVSIHKATDSSRSFGRADLQHIGGPPHRCQKTRVMSHKVLNYQLGPVDRRVARIAPRAQGPSNWTAHPRDSARVRHDTASVRVAATSSYTQ